MKDRNGGTITISDDKITKLRHKLKQAIQLNNSTLFRSLIDESDASICRSALESYDSETDMSPFEIACKEANRVYFIRECISIGCDANKRNPKCGRRPMSFAIENFRCENVEALLDDTSVCVDIECSFNYRFTPIDYLINRISDELYEFKESIRCIELLVEHCADVNNTGRDGKTPIQNILEKRNLNDMGKRFLVQCIFDHAKYIDIDHTNGTIRTQINELIPDLKLPTTTVGIELEVNATYIDRCLKNPNGSEIEFWQHYRLDKDHSLETYWHFALEYAVRRGLTYSVERIFRLGVITTMHSLDECKEPLLTSAVRFMGRNNDENIEKCVNLFLNHQKIDVNARDKFGFAALSSAVRSAQTNVTTKLLERGAYIGMESKWGDVAITDIQPQLLEKHFDRCITTTTIYSASNESLELTFDYQNLIPLYSSDRLTTFCEMKAIDCILKTYTLRHLIKHPLIESFLDLKWNRLAFIFYTNFFFCALFAMLNIVEILLFFLDDIEPIVSMTVCQMILLCAMIGRETIQIISSPWGYVERYQNYLECALIGLILYILFGNCPIAWRGTVSAVAILLIAYEFSLLIGSLPIRSVAIHYNMLETVATNFFKSLLFYSTIIAAFAFAFCCLFHKVPPEIDENVANKTDDHEHNYNNFQSVGLSMIKSIVMANGELDTASIQFNGNVFSYIVFVAFILLVTTVLGNLLSGLAVSDINEIRSQAQWTHLLRRCELLARYEKSFLDENSWVIWFHSLRHFIRSKTCLYPDFQFNYQKKITLNKRNEKNFRQLLGGWFRYIKLVICFDTHEHIEKDIVKEALQRVDSNENDGSDIEMLRKEISKISYSHELLRHQVDSIEKTVKSIERMFMEEVQSKLS